MKKNAIFCFFVILLAFVLTIISCDDGESDIWIDVTNFSQLNGTWKSPSSYSITNGGITQNTTTNNYLITFNSITETMSHSGTTTIRYTGENINSLWSSIKMNMESMILLDIITVTTNDTNYSITITYNNFTIQISNNVILQLGFQINQNGTKIINPEGIIFTKQ